MTNAEVGQASNALKEWFVSQGMNRRDAGTVLLYFLSTEVLDPEKLPMTLEIKAPLK